MKEVIAIAAAVVGAIAAVLALNKAWWLVFAAAIVVVALGFLAWKRVESSQPWRAVAAGTCAGLLVGLGVFPAMAKAKWSWPFEFIGAIQPSPAVGSSPSQNRLTQPKIHNLAVKWLGDDGRYQITGQLEGTEPSDLVWSYNQPFDYETKAPGPIYPDVGPCVITKGSTFLCDLGYAGSLACDGGRKFALWVAVVTEEHAHDAALLHSNYEGRQSYANNTSILHIAGEEALQSIIDVHPGARRIPKPANCA